MRHMQSIFRRSSHEMPGLNLSSMPDLIFTVLFFFMIVTHMRHDDVKVRYEVPAGTEVQKLQQKIALMLKQQKWQLKTQQPMQQQKKPLQIKSHSA